MELDLHSLFFNSGHEIELALISYRAKYEASSPEERKAAKSWVASLVEFEAKQSSLSAIPTSRMWLRFMEQSDNDHSDWRRVTLPAFILLNALDAWDRGEFYLPKIDDLLYKDR